MSTGPASLGVMRRIWTKSSRPSTVNDMGTSARIVCVKKWSPAPSCIETFFARACRLLALSTGAAATRNDTKPEDTGHPRSATDTGSKQHATERERVKGASSRKRDGGRSAVAEAKGAQEAASGDGEEGDEKGAGRGLASLGDLPSLGRKMVSPRVVSTWTSMKCQSGAIIHTPRLMAGVPSLEQPCENFPPRTTTHLLAPTLPTLPGSRRILPP